MDQFKEIEMAKIRQEEKERLRLEMEAVRLNLEHTYQKRNETLNQKEQSLNDLLKQKKELEEHELFIQRQHLLNEMKQLKEREAEFRRNTEAQSKFNQIDAGKYEKLDEDLKKRELNLKQEQELFDQKLRDERERIKLDLERAFAQKEFALQSVDTKNKQDSAHNEIERAHLERVKREYQNQQIKSTEIEIELQKCLGQLECLRQENELIKQKLTHCMDYDFIKQENNMLKYKLDVSKEIIGKKSMASSRRSISEKPSYVPQRKRSVTFADNNNPMLDSGIVPPLLLSQNGEYSMMQATEMGADQLSQDPFKKDLINENEALETLRDVGDRVLSDEIERSEIKESLEHHSLVNNELKDLYEMQVYEQRKLQETINDVKKHVEFLYHGVAALPDHHEKTSYTNEAVLNTSLEFIDSAKERLKYLENEGEKIEQNYRDYQHKIRSKYYPITENDSNELKIKEKMNEHHKTIDIEKFMESTLKASLNAKLMREEIEADFIKTMAAGKNENPVFSLSGLKNVEEKIRSVPMIIGPDVQISMDSIKQQILNDQNDLKQFQVSKTSNYILKQDRMDNSSQSLTFSPTIRQKSFIKQPSVDNEEEPSLTEKQSLSIKKDSLSAMSSPKAKKNFGLGDYVKLFDEKKEESNKIEKVNESPKKATVKIEYSSSTSSVSSTSSNSSEDESQAKTNFTKKKEVVNKDDDEDDFNW